MTLLFNLKNIFGNRPLQPPRGDSWLIHFSRFAACSKTQQMDDVMYDVYILMDECAFVREAIDVVGQLFKLHKYY